MWATSTLLACGFSGEGGVIDYLPGTIVHRPIARGGTATYSIAEADGELVEVASLTPGVVEVVGFGASWFTVRAIATGPGRVRTRTSISEDVAPLEVRAASSVRLAMEIQPSEWRQLLLEADPSLVPPSTTLAVVRGAPPVDAHFDLLDAAGELLVDNSTSLRVAISSNALEPTTRVEIPTGGGPIPLAVDVVDGPDRLVRHGGANTVWALGPDEVFCVAAMSGSRALADRPMTAETTAPWRVREVESSAEFASFASCFLVELDEAATPSAAEVVVTSGSLTFVQPVEGR